MLDREFSITICLSIIALFSPSSIYGSEDFDGGLQGVEIAPKVLTNVQYGNSRLSVWGHLDNPNRPDDKKKYFVMPVVMLLPKTGTCHSNVFTGEITLQFKLVMWNEDVASAVLVHLREATDNQQLRSIQITTLPMEQVRLVWVNSVQQLSADFKFNTKWKSYANQDNILRFEVVISSREVCQRALEQLQERPDSLGSLELQYVLHGTRASRKQITVTGRHILQGNMYAQIKNKVGSDGNVYITSEDLNLFSHQITNIVAANSVTDADYIDTGDSVSLSKLVYDSLATFRQTSATMTPKMWESTFWQNDFVRPDKLTNYLNKVINKDNSKFRTFHVNERQVNDDYSGVNLGIFELFGASVSSRHTTHVSDEDMREWLNEHNFEVEWTGERFQMKPIDLYRLNTEQLTQKQSIVTTYVQVHQVQYTYNVKVTFPNEAMNNVTYVPTSAINKRLERLEYAEEEETDMTEALKAETATRIAAFKQQKDEIDALRLRLSKQDTKLNNVTYVPTSAINKRLERLENAEKEAGTDMTESIKTEAANIIAAALEQQKEEIDALKLRLSKQDAKLNPLKLLRNSKLCEYFRTEESTYTCPINRKIGFCTCIIYSHTKDEIWPPTINGNVCECESEKGKPQGTCCLSVD